jgi:spore germination protein
MDKRCLMPILLLSLLTGCFPKTQILEDIQLVQSVAYDYLSEKNIKVGAEATITPRGEDVQLISEIFKAESHTNKSARKIIESESPKPFRIGRLGVVLFNKKLAEEGIYKIVDVLQRDPSIGRDIFMVVAENSAIDILEGEYSVSETPSKYLTNMLDQNMRSNIPRSSIHLFLYRYHGKGMDPFMPLIEKKGNHIRIKGVALFKGDKYKGYINIRNAFFLKLLRESFEDGMFEVKYGENNYYTIENISSQVDFKVKNANKNPEITMDVKVTGRINEAPKILVGKKNVIDQLEKTASEMLEKDMEAMIKKFQRLNVDPLALGDRVRSRTRNFDFKNWEGKYPEVPIDINVAVQIIQSGIMD